MPSDEETKPSNAPLDFAPEVIDEDGDPSIEKPEGAGRVSGQATAKKAAELLVKSHGFVLPTRAQRRIVAMAFAGKEKVVYGKAFDLLKVKGDRALDLNDLADVERQLDRITLYEVKSTSRSSVAQDLGGYFFSLTTAELLVAQSLGDSFRFAFVHVGREEVTELRLRDVYAKARAIYPTWSIQF